MESDSRESGRTIYDLTLKSTLCDLSDFKPHRSGDMIYPRGSENLLHSQSLTDKTGLIEKSTASVSVHPELIQLDDDDSESNADLSPSTTNSCHSAGFECGGLWNLDQEMDDDDSSNSISPHADLQTPALENDTMNAMNKDRFETATPPLWRCFTPEEKFSSTEKAIADSSGVSCISALCDDASTARPFSSLLASSPELHLPDPEPAPEPQGQSNDIDTRYTDTCTQAPTHFPFHGNDIFYRETFDQQIGFDTEYGSTNRGYISPTEYLNQPYTESSRVQNQTVQLYNSRPPSMGEPNVAVCSQDMNANNIVHVTIASTKGSASCSMSDYSTQAQLGNVCSQQNTVFQHNLFHQQRTTPNTEKSVFPYCGNDQHSMNSCSSPSSYLSQLSPVSCEGSMVSTDSNENDPATAAGPSWVGHAPNTTTVQFQQNTHQFNPVNQPWESNMRYQVPYPWVFPNRNMYPHMNGPNQSWTGPPAQSYVYAQHNHLTHQSPYLTPVPVSMSMRPRIPTGSCIPRNDFSFNPPLRQPHENPPMPSSIPRWAQFQRAPQQPMYEFNPYQYDAVYPPSFSPMCPPPLGRHMSMPNRPKNVQPPTQKERMEPSSPEENREHVVMVPLPDNFTIPPKPKCSLQQFAQDSSGYTAIQPSPSHSVIGEECCESKNRKRGTVSIKTKEGKFLCMASDFHTKSVRDLLESAETCKKNAETSSKEDNDVDVGSGEPTVVDMEDDDSPSDETRKTKNARSSTAGCCPSPSLSQCGTTSPTYSPAVFSTSTAQSQLLVTAGCHHSSKGPFPSLLMPPMTVSRMMCDFSSVPHRYARIEMPMQSTSSGPYTPHPGPSWPLYPNPQQGQHVIQDTRQPWPTNPGFAFHAPSQAGSPLYTLKNGQSLPMNTEFAFNAPSQVQGFATTGTPNTGQSKSTSDSELQQIPSQCQPIRTQWNGVQNTMRISQHNAALQGPTSWHFPSGAVTSWTGNPTEPWAMNSRLQRAPSQNLSVATTCTHPETNALPSPLNTEDNDEQPDIAMDQSEPASCLPNMMQVSTMNPALQSVPSTVPSSTASSGVGAHGAIRSLLLSPSAIQHPTASEQPAVTSCTPNVIHHFMRTPGIHGKYRPVTILPPREVQLRTAQPYPVFPPNYLAMTVPVQPAVTNSFSHHDPTNRSEESIGNVDPSELQESGMVLPSVIDASSPLDDSFDDAVTETDREIERMKPTFVYSEELKEERNKLSMGKGHHFKPKHFEFTSLQIGTFKYTCALSDLQKTAKVKIIFSQKKMIYEFQLNDMESVRTTKKKQLAVVEVPFSTILSLWGGGRELKVEVNEAPKMYLGEQCFMKERKFGNHLNARYDRTKELDMTGGQLSLVPYHYIHLKGACQKLKHSFQLFDEKFELLLQLPFIEVPTKVLVSGNPFCNFIPAPLYEGNQVIADIVKRKTPPTVIVGPLVKPEPPESGCHCSTGCRTARCRCSKRMLACGRLCQCKNCSNIFNVLKQANISGEAAKADCCLMQNLFKVTNLERFLESELVLPCCDLTLPMKKCVPGQFSCPNSPTCNKRYSFSWCSSTLCDMSVSPRNHCPVCRSCCGQMYKHCEKCNRCYFAGTSSFNCPNCNAADIRAKEQARLAAILPADTDPDKGKYIILAVEEPLS